MIKQFFLLVFILCHFLGTVNAATTPPQLQSESWVLIDRLTNTTLAHKIADKRVNPGNTVLLMVLYTTEQAIKENVINRSSLVTINNDALSIPPLNAARFYLEPNQTVSVSNL